MERCLMAGKSGWISPRLKGRIRRHRDSTWGSTGRTTIWIGLLGETGAEREIGAGAEKGMEELTGMKVEAGMRVGMRAETEVGHQELQLGIEVGHLEAQ